jgi:hypothetical protein
MKKNSHYTLSLTFSSSAIKFGYEIADILFLRAFKRLFESPCQYVI